jgi:putative methyltransferase (TIGR04325 family)
MRRTDRLKSIARLLLPPIVTEGLRHSLGAARNGILFAGDYPSWQSARRDASGYDEPSILRKTLAAALKVHRNEAPYERDSVLFDKVEYSFPLLAGLLFVASREDGRLSVLDFGGALGSCYYQNRGFLGHLKHLRWSIVEQEHYVRAGQDELQTDVLRFYRTIDECISAEQPNFILLSSVLQYLEDPYALLAQIKERRIPYLLLDRTPVIHGLPGRITVQTVPPQIYSASYPCRIFGYEELEQRLLQNYRLLAPFEAHAGTVIDLGNAKAGYAGWFLERKEVDT